MYEFDSKGNAIDPPVISSYEDRIRVASAQGDADELDAIHKDYRTERNRRAKRANDREKAAS